MLGHSLGQNLFVDLASSIMLFSGHGPVHQTKLGADFVASLEVATLVKLTN